MIILLTTQVHCVGKTQFLSAEAGGGYKQLSDIKKSRIMTRSCRANNLQEHDDDDDDDDDDIKTIDDGCGYATRRSDTFVSSRSVRNVAKREY
jgi:phosphopantetheine adenylyltransferase